MLVENINAILEFLSSQLNISNNASLIHMSNP